MWRRRFDPMEAARSAVDAARQAVGDRLLSAALYGSAARGEFDSAHSDVNVVFVFTTLGAAELEALRPGHRSWVRHRVARPLLLARKSLEDSQDTFPLEYLLLRQWHQVLHGPDLYAGLRVDHACLRSAVERLLRAQELGLAVSWVALAGTPGGARHWAAQASRAIGASASGLLHLVGEPIPARRADLAERCAARFGVERDALLALLTRDPDRPRVEASRLLESAKLLVERLLAEAERLDGTPNR
jgi:predicted nucleotidyltransferase